MASRAVLEVKKISKAYEKNEVLKDVSFVVKEGEVTVLIGPNGSGKTTLVRAVTGLVTIASGEISILGAKAGSDDARSVTSVSLDTPILYDDISALEHLEFSARINGLEDWESPAKELLASFGLSERQDELPSSFSRGLRQKVALAMALIRPHRLLILDEPFVGLDQRGKASLIQLIKDQATRGVAVLVATHSEEFLAVANSMIGMSEGQALYRGSPSKDQYNKLVG
ncbi:MAG: ABC transporter ATP-binding protein [Acidimicrobiaceae bacterium]|nr:ABC transporter ATP-binding protein [Acidimicrobiaceae bacterium]